MLQDRPTEVSATMIEVTEDDLFGSDIDTLPKVMNDLVNMVEVEAEDFDELNMPENATKMVKEVNEVSCLI